MTYRLGRLIDHVHLRVRDLEASQRFYEGALGLEVGSERRDHFYLDELYVSPDGPPTERLHLAFSAADRGAVERFLAAAISAGGCENGAPGLRAYGPGYYADFVLDPDGNNVEAVVHETSSRSADAIVVEVPNC